jgi:hypothetical protein
MACEFFCGTCNAGLTAEFRCHNGCSEAAELKEALRQRDEARAHLHIAGKRADEAERRESTVRAALEAEKKRSAEMHRRAQVSEGAAERVARLHESFAKDLRYYINRGHSMRAHWRGLYRAAVDQLIAAGAPDHHDDPTSLCRKTGMLDVLITRLVAERDESRAAAAAASAGPLMSSGTCPPAGGLVAAPKPLDPAGSAVAGGEGVAPPVRGRR